MKTLEIIGGPNGSGKSTFAEMQFAKTHDLLFVNSDKIAGGFTMNGNVIAQFEAGRIMLEQIEKYLNENRSFGFESTLSGKIWRKQIEKAKRQEYKVIIYFVYVDSIAVSLKRIRNRVKNGGHDIPKEIVKRRFKRTFSNFINLYAPLADEWHIIDNTYSGTIIANKIDGNMNILDEKKFNTYFT